MKESSRPGRLYLYQAMGVYHSPYCPIARVLSGVPNCLPSGSNVLQAPGLQGGIFIDQITCYIYTCDYVYKFFMSTGKIDHDMADNLQRVLRNQNQK